MKGKIKALGRKIGESLIRFISYIRRYPIETIELLSSIVLLIFAIYLMIPLEWLGQVFTAYDSSTTRSIFGVLTSLPAIYLLFTRFKGNMKEYVFYKQRSRRQALFWMTFAWFYMGMLRGLTATLLPPIFILYLLSGLITLVCYVRLGG